MLCVFRLTLTARHAASTRRSPSPSPTTTAHEVPGQSPLGAFLVCVAAECGLLTSAYIALPLARSTISFTKTEATTAATSLTLTRRRLCFKSAAPWRFYKRWIKGRLLNGQVVDDGRWKSDGNERASLKRELARATEHVQKRDRRLFS